MYFDQSKMTEYPEVAREEMARYGSQDALGNGQEEQEQEQEQESRSDDEESAVYRAWVRAHPRQPVRSVWRPDRAATKNKAGAAFVMKIK